LNRKIAKAKKIRTKTKNSIMVLILQETKIDVVIDYYHMPFIYT